MSTPSSRVSTTIDIGQPAWRIALFYPKQGGWTEADYLALEGGPLVEFDSGCVEVLDMPTKEHQRIVQLLLILLQQLRVPKGMRGSIRCPVARPVVAR